MEISRINKSTCRISGNIENYKTSDKIREAITENLREVLSNHESD